MQQSTGTHGRRPHIDTLQVKPGYYFGVSTVETRSPITEPRKAAPVLPAVTVDDAGWWA